MNGAGGVNGVDDCKTGCNYELAEREHLQQHGKALESQRIYCKTSLGNMQGDTGAGVPVSKGAMNRCIHGIHWLLGHGTVAKGGGTGLSGAQRELPILDGARTKPKTAQHAEGGPCHQNCAVMYVPSTHTPPLRAASAHRLCAPSLRAVCGCPRIGLCWGVGMMSWLVGREADLI